MLRRLLVLQMLVLATKAVLSTNNTGIVTSGRDRRRQRRWSRTINYV